MSLSFIVERLLGGRIKRKISWGLGIALHSILIFIGIVFSYDTYTYVHVAVQVLQLSLLQLCTKNTKIVSIIGIYIGLYSINTITILTIDCFLSLSINAIDFLEFCINTLWFSCCCICCFYRPLCLVIKNILKTLPSPIKVLTIFSFATSAWIMAFVLFNPTLKVNPSWDITIRISFVLFSTFIGVSFPVLLIAVLTNSYLKKQNEIFENDLHAQANHYIALAKANYELRRFKHDFNNIKIGLSKSVHDNNYDGALAIIQDMDSAMQKATDGVNRFDTGNGIVDAILSDKQAKAKDKHITLDFRGSLPSHSLSPIDLCVIFGNTIDNAIEACERLPMNIDKTIYVRSQCNSGFVFISIENPVERNVKISNNYIETTKAERSAHGYGLYSLNKTVKKYDGDLKLSCENYKFKVEIDLSINSSK